jgi:alkanesulfonate monooxygenase SsuD/methylene tetrahydromethanopterin reductase-like flavin-dependent oxidoreductase (luciferase family)
VTPRYGLWLFPGLAGPMGQNPFRWNPGRVVEAVALADAAGIHEVWLGDEGPAGWDPFVVSALALAGSQKVRIGIGVANPISRHPSVVATAAITLDMIAPGRLILGLGTGGSIPLSPFGLVGAKVSEMAEAIRLIRLVLDPMNQSNPSYAAPEGAISAPKLQVYVGARGPRLNALASEMADGAMLSGIPDDQLDQVVGWAQSDRKINLSILPVSAPNEPEAKLVASLSSLRLRYPDAVIGASLTDSDPVAGVSRLISALTMLPKG